MQNAAKKCDPVREVSDAELKALAESIYVRLSAAQCTSRQSLKVLSHLLSLVTEAITRTVTR